MIKQRPALTPGLIVAAIFAIINAAFIMFSVWEGDGVTSAFYIPHTIEGVSYQRITGLKEICESQMNQYFFTNGRFVCHFFVQMFCALTPKWVFALCNAMVLFALLMEVFHICNKSEQFWTKSIGLGSLVWLITFYLPFDPPLQLNYIWSAAVNLAVIIIFFKNIQPCFSTLIGIGLLAFIAGEWNESFSMPIALSLLIYAIKQRFHVIPVQWVIGIAYAIGTLVLCLAPGNFLRYNTINQGGSSIIAVIAHIYIPMLLPTALLIIIACHRWIKHRALKLDDVDKFFIMVAVFGYLISFALKVSSGPRMLICAGTATIILFGRWFKFNKPGLVFILILALAAGVYQYKILTVLNDKYTLLNKLYKESADGKVFLPDELFAADYMYAKQMRNGQVQPARELDPDKPYLTTLPESAQGLKVDIDTNYCVQYGPQSWLLVRSRKHPADFVTDKVVLPGILNLKIPSRILSFAKDGQVAIDSTDAVIIGVYINQFPFMHSEININSSK